MRAGLLEAVPVRGLAVCLSVALCGCAVVRVDVDRSVPAVREVRTLQGSGSAELASAAKAADAAERAALLVEAARRSAPDGAVHRSALRQLVGIMADRSFEPLPLPDGAGTLEAAQKTTRTTLDPRSVTQILPAEAIRIRGLRARTRQDGAGVPCVAWTRAGSPSLRGEPGIPKSGLSEPVTATLAFRGRTAQVVFHRTRRVDTAVVGGRTVRLAADFSAPLAYLISQGANRALDLKALVWSDRNVENAGLFQLDPYEPGKIPVVFVHGLMSRPEAWTPAVNQLLADPEVRRRYQFWVFIYPTGLPVWWTAAKLRLELDRYRDALDPERTNPALDNMVLVGHSMGGLISSLQVREGGPRLWGQFSDMSPDDVGFSEATRQQIDEMVFFEPRTDVDRVVFFAVPHRGSGLAANPVATFLAGLIRLPFFPLQEERPLLLSALREDVRSAFSAPVNSIRFLRARSPQILSILQLPLREGVVYHSIIGDRGRGNTPNSSDGVVPYWSSHLEGASSEKIVPSGHGANENAEGIEELRRILRLHSGSPEKG